MSRRPRCKIGRSFLVVALAATLVLGGVLAACGKAQSTTSTPASTATSATTRTTTSTATSTTSSVTTQSTTSTPRPTTSATTTLSAADFYKSNLVALVVPYGAGGGVDFAARLFANYWTEVTGGRMIVENREGGGGVAGTNYVYVAKPDGLTLGVNIPGSGLIAPMLGQEPAVKYDLKKMSWIEFTNPDGNTLGISAKSTYANMQDFSKAKGLKFGTSGRVSTPSLGSALVIEFFGLQDAKLVHGYSGTTEAILAVAKGEVDGYVSSALLDSVTKGLIKTPILSVDFQRNPYFPDTPAVPELLKLSPAQESLLRTYTALAPGQLFWAPPGVPQDRLDFVRSTFDKIVANENFVKLAKTRWPVWVPPTSGKDYAAQMEKTLAVATPEKFIELQKVVDRH